MGAQEKERKGESECVLTFGTCPFSQSPFLLFPSPTIDQFSWGAKSRRGEVCDALGTRPSLSFDLTFALEQIVRVQIHNARAKRKTRPHLFASHKKLPSAPSHGKLANLGAGRMRARGGKSNRWTKTFHERSPLCQKHCAALIYTAGFPRPTRPFVSNSPRH